MITDYASLQDQVANHLGRTDLTSVIPTLIQVAEDSFLHDPDGRVVKLTNRGQVTISPTGDVNLPSDLFSVDSWYYDGDLAFGPLDVVGADAIGTLKAQYGASGMPRAVAIVDGVARFAPAPDGVYQTRMTYWRKITRLSATNTTNWLLREAPSGYLFATLAEAGPYLKDPEQAALWASKADRVLEGYRTSQNNAQFGGTIRRQHRAIGG